MTRNIVVESERVKPDVPENPTDSLSTVKFLSPIIRPPLSSIAATNVSISSCGVGGSAVSKSKVVTDVDRSASGLMQKILNVSNYSSQIIVSLCYGEWRLQ